MIPGIVGSVPDELPKALLLEEVVAPGALAEALYVSVTRGVPLARALVDRGAVAQDVVVRYLARGEAPFVPHVVPIPDLVERLPHGLCERLLAVPVGCDAITAVVEVALADATDAHPAREIAYHLQAQVRIVRAPLAAIEDALGRLGGSRRRARRDTPTWGTPVHPQVQEPAEQGRRGLGSEIPIPLTRRTFIAAPGGTQRPLPMVGPADVGLGGGYRVDPAIHAALRAAATRDEVLDLVLTGARAIASRVALFVVKRDGYLGRTCTPEFGDRGALHAIVVPRAIASVFDRAIGEGLYLGPIRRDEAHAALLDVMRGASRDVAVVPIRVAGKAAVVIVADELGDPLPATQRLEELASAAGEAFARIVRARR